MNEVILNGITVTVFSGVDDLLGFVNNKNGILVAVNAEKIINRDHRIKEIINNNIGYLDGAGPVLAARRKGISDACKIPGCELWLKLVKRSYHSRSFYLLGSTRSIIEETARQLHKDFPGISIVGYHDGYLTTDKLKSDVITDIISKKPDVVFVAMGSPKQELFMAELQELHPALYMGLGGSFDIYAGNVKRAPRWWIDHNLEFAYRLFKQPKRIRRQIHLLRFAWWILTDKM